MKGWRNSGERVGAITSLIKLWSASLGDAVSSDYPPVSFPALFHIYHHSAFNYAADVPRLIFSEFFPSPHDGP